MLLAACGAGSQATSEPTGPGATAGPATPSPAAATATTAPATAAPTILPRPSGTLPWPTAFAVEMAAGTWFTSPPFLVPLAITVSEAGWYAGHINPVFIDLQRFDGVEVGTFPTRMLAFGWPENVRGDGGPVPVEGLTPAAALDLLAGRGSLTAGERAPVELFGLAGERIDLHSDFGNTSIFGTADGDFGLGPELDLRLAALTLGEGLLMVGVLAPAADLEDAWDQALPMLESVEVFD